MATRSVDTVARCCISLGFECWEALASSSRLLFSLGYSQYRVREFWSELNSRGGIVRIPLYNHSGAELGLEASLYEGPFYEYNCGDYIIPLMTSREPSLRRASVQRVPRGLALQVAINGSAGGVSVQVNVVRLLVLLYKSKPRLARDLVSAVIEAGWGRPHMLINVVDEVVVELSNILNILLPGLPKSHSDLGRYLPFLYILRQ